MLFSNCVLSCMLLCVVQHHDCSQLVFKKGVLSDFHSVKPISRIAFGSCSKHNYHQHLWPHVVKQNADVWLWLGDAVYADHRVLPFLWIPTALETMKQKFDAQKEIPGYKALISSNATILGVWDDHDYGIDGGGMTFKQRFQAQKLFLDFIDEPLDSVRRGRKGIYASYTFGERGQLVKLILLDVRSHLVSGSTCDVLGEEQWHWLERQLLDEYADLVLIGTGKQVLSDIPFIDKWMSCAASLDRLIWTVQKQSNVIFLSGDVHFSEVNCLNSTGTGYPLYEVTSSSMTHSCSASLLPPGICDWTLKNVVASRFRVSNVVTDNSFAVIHIDWGETPVVRFELIGEQGTVLSQLAVSLADLKICLKPSVCPPAIEQPNWYWKRVFWTSVVSGAVMALLLAFRLVFVLGRWIASELLKDLDEKIKRRMKKLRLLYVGRTGAGERNHKAPASASKEHVE